MKTSISFNNEPAIFNPDFEYVRTESWKAVTIGSTVQICAWCDPSKDLAQKLTKAGYKLTHGVCEKHKGEWMEKMNHTN